MSATDRQLIADMYKAYGTGNVQAMSRPFTEQSVWIELGKNQRTGTFRGTQQILEHRGKGHPCR